jgi:hypothetical protein
MALNPNDWQGDAAGNYYGPRWSLSLARPPASMYQLSDAAVRWWHDNVFDNANVTDPQAYSQKLINDWRAEAVRRGITPDQTDVDVMEYVASGTFPQPAGSTDAYQQQLLAAARANPSLVDQSLISGSGQVDASDANVLAWLQQQGVPLQPSSGSPYYSPSFGPPVPGVISGQVNMPSSANSGPASANAYPVGPAATNTAVNQGAPLALFGSSGGSWIWLVAAAAAIYLLAGKR